MIIFWETLAGIALVTGLFFMLLGAIGIVRMPDVYLRLHAATKCSTLGLGLLLAGAVLHLRGAAVIDKSVMVLVFAFVAAPVGSHMLAKAAMRTRARQWRYTLDDEHAEDHPELTDD